jgi:hypothetical protein
LISSDGIRWEETRKVAANMETLAYGKLGAPD